MQQTNSSLALLLVSISQEMLAEPSPDLLRQCSQGLLRNLQSSDPSVFSRLETAARSLGLTETEIRSVPQCTQLPEEQEVRDTTPVHVSLKTL